MKRLFILLAIVSLAFTLTSCTDNIRAKSWGGTINLNLEPGQQLVNATWKGSELWLLTTKRQDSTAPKTYHFMEDSSFGVMEGSVYIIEN